MPSRFQQKYSRHSSSALKLLRLGSYHFLINIILMILGLGLLVFGLIGQTYQWLQVGLVICAFWLLSVCVFHLHHSSKCPDCLSRIWRKCGSRKHHKAKRLLGMSHRLTIATSTISHKNYHCPHCGELICTRKIKN